MVFQIYHHKNKKNVKITFVHFTKLPIKHYMDMYPSIARRNEEPFHSLKRDDIITSVNIQKTNRRKQRIRLQDTLLTNSVKATNAYAKYDEA